MSIEAMSWAWGVGGLSPSEKLVLVAIADGADMDGFYEAKYFVDLKGNRMLQGAIAIKTCMSVEQFKEAILNLNKKNVVGVNEQSCGTESGVVHVIRVGILELFKGVAA